MDAPRRRRAGTVAIVALTLLIGASGGATAAKLITGKDIKDASLTGKDIKDASLTGKDVKNGSLSPKDVSGALLTGVEVVVASYPAVFIVNSGGQRGLSEAQTATCPAGMRVIGGGFDLGTDASENGVHRQVTASASEPTADGKGWSVQLFNNGTASFQDVSIDLEVTAVCVSLS
jgi:hypothetical protein